MSKIVPRHGLRIADAFSGAETSLRTILHGRHDLTARLLPATAVLRFNPRSLCLLILWLFSAEVFGGNPLVPGIGLTDPHGVVYGDRVFLYATHDFSPANKTFVMKDWWVWSSDNLVDWRQEGTLKPEDTFLKRPFDSCWASFGISKNGKYYWYFSAGPKQIGVVVADSPAGPWRDPLGKPLIPEGLVATQERDPDVFIDDDGKAYVIFGTFNYFIVQLNDDMTSLADAPHPVAFDRREGPYGAGKTDDKPSLHKRNGIYYASWSSFYAISSNVYGPYTMKGSVITSSLVAQDFSGQKPVQDRHGNFFQFNQQWYYACNDMSQPGCSHYYRDCILSYVHYRDNGEIAPVRIDKIGVGEYDATSPQIEAEDYFKLENGEVRDSPTGGFEVRNLSANSQLYFPKVMNLRANTSLTFSAACGAEGGMIEIHNGNPTGEVLGTCAISSTGGWDKYQPFTCSLKNNPGTLDLCFVCKGGVGELMRLDWFKF